MFIKKGLGAFSKQKKRGAFSRRITVQEATVETPTGSSFIGKSNTESVFAVSYRFAVFLWFVVVHPLNKAFVK
jgi:hypothetical protein